jgi:hypothetical protein
MLIHTVSEALKVAAYIYLYIRLVAIPAVLQSGHFRSVVVNTLLRPRSCTRGANVDTASGYIRLSCPPRTALTAQHHDFQHIPHIRGLLPRAFEIHPNMGYTLEPKRRGTYAP